ncbi:MAG: hypothetical protein GDA56_28585 [Hormoscilla sp. GM7CHS1pb]|nr:hypothetical protein [Hormoscilla sp. GM7CHS1pb]
MTNFTEITASEPSLLLSVIISLTDQGSISDSLTMKYFCSLPNWDAPQAHQHEHEHEHYYQSRCHSLHDISFPSSLAGWDVGTHKDEMTGEITGYFAISDFVTSTKPIDFPYTGMESMLFFRCNTEDESMFVFFDREVDLVRFLGLSEARIKFDNEIMIATRSYYRGKRNILRIFLSKEGVDIDRFINHMTVKLELVLRGQGEVYFEYSLEGSSDAIRRAREMYQQ